jgi:hypothetical protein
MREVAVITGPSTVHQRDCNLGKPSVARGELVIRWLENRICNADIHSPKQWLRSSPNREQKLGFGVQGF